MFAGVLEAVRISCAGFPSKRPYGEFVDHFWMLAPQLLRHADNLDDREITKRLLTLAELEGYQLGETKVGETGFPSEPYLCPTLDTGPRVGKVVGFDCLDGGIVSRFISGWRDSL